MNGDVLIIAGGLPAPRLTMPDNLSMARLGLAGVLFTETVVAGFDGLTWLVRKLASEPRGQGTIVMNR
ncbi:hypothetical protein [Pseudoduganella lutea]|uniref:Uncharacterized protein n=1 Tax=Pseudoduganella lutea TaxID=321985 RepID=A0A4P6KSU5_9BURK|nr:hypothetical protein [Pseudoduganella lutea]QBE61714.1 hypothetical protein EWM63_00800 [Pseudoduganella lutea]